MKVGNIYTDEIGHVIQEHLNLFWVRWDNGVVSLMSKRELIFL